MLAFSFFKFPLKYMLSSIYINKIQATQCLYISLCYRKGFPMLSISISFIVKGFCLSIVHQGINKYISNASVIEIYNTAFRGI